MLLQIIFSSCLAFMIVPEQVLVKGPELRLSDIFISAPDKVIGSSPKVGQKIILSPTQLADLAAEHKLAWKPTEQYVKIERATATISFDDIKPFLLHKVAQLINYKFHLNVNQLDWRQAVPLEEKEKIKIENLQVNAGSSQWQANVVVGDESNPASITPLSGQIIRMKSIPVLNRIVTKGEEIHADDITFEEFPETQLASAVIQDEQFLIGKTARNRELVAKKPITANEVRAPQVIHTGAIVTVSYRTPYMHLTNKAQAMTAAARGETIRLKTQAKKEIEAIATGPNLAEIIVG